MCSGHRARTAPSRAGRNSNADDKCRPRVTMTGMRNAMKSLFGILFRWLALPFLLSILIVVFWIAYSDELMWVELPNGGIERIDWRDDAIEQAFVWNLTEYPERKGKLYVSVEGSDPDEGMLKRLNQQLPTINFVPFGERDASKDECSAREGLINMGPCEMDNYFKLSAIEPLWRFAVVHWNTAACTGNIRLIRLDKWRAVSDSWGCI